MMKNRMMTKKIRRCIAGAATAAIIYTTVAMSGWCVPANSTELGGSLGQQDAYLLAEKVVADLPEGDWAKVHLIPPGTPTTGRVPCWPLHLKWRSYYCPTSGSVVLSAGTVNNVRLAGGEPGIWFLIGHELGHGQQPLRTLWTLSSLTREANADCFGGAYAAAHLGRGSGTRDGVAAAADALGGDNPVGWDFHGTGTQRKDAALSGFDHGTAICRTQATT